MKYAVFVYLGEREMSATMRYPLGMWHGICHPRYFSGLIFGEGGAEEWSRGCGREGEHVAKGNRVQKEIQ